MGLVEGKNQNLGVQGFQMVESRRLFQGLSLGQGLGLDWVASRSPRQPPKRIREAELAAVMVRIKIVEVGICDVYSLISRNRQTT